MLRYRRSLCLRRVVLPLTLLAFMSACHKWVPLEPPVAQAITEEQPGTVRVTLTDNSQTVLEAPRVSGDSLVAIDGSVALDDVQRAEAKRANTPATIGLVVGIAAVAFVAFVAVVLIAYCSSTPDCT